jgi:hypothetical protein
VGSQTNKTNAKAQYVRPANRDSAKVRFPAKVDHPCREVLRSRVLHAAWPLTDPTCSRHGRQIGSMRIASAYANLDHRPLFWDWVRQVQQNIHGEEEANAFEYHVNTFVTEMRSNMAYYETLLRRTSPSLARYVRQ